MAMPSPAPLHGAAGSGAGSGRTRSTTSIFPTAAIEGRASMTRLIPSNASAVPFERAAAAFAARALQRRGAAQARFVLVAPEKPRCLTGIARD